MSETRRVAVVSGAGRGIGAATARELGRRDYHVIVNYLRNADAAAAVVEDIESAGGSARAVRADVCDDSQVATLVHEVLDEHRRIDVLVCNANTAAPPFAPIVALPWKAFAGKVMAELSGAYFLTQRVVPIMRAQRAGRIVYVSSTAADVLSGSAAHSTAKAALNTFGQQVAGETARYGITVNTVAAGAVETDATAVVFTEGVRRYLRDRSVRGRLLEPDDLARAIGLVLDDAFTVATGQLIRIDAGMDLLSQQLDGFVAQFGGHDG
jgi:3-oxoacyl-[acyl-carrier protein] reductase